ncbi:unnamed protein product [Urochloa decumbens]|uniref:F-box domain-containing protein n=1 Tax=Urochloa decumbens TaxID=240449 RepID=A0ABC9EHJ9_9POAL
MLTRSMKRMKTKVASTGAPELPDELMTEVLLRLPIKSILRCRAVCRAWAATLSSYGFCSLHMAHGDAAHAASSARPKLLLVAPATAACDATAVCSCSPQEQAGPGGGANLTTATFTLDELRGDFVGGVAAQCRGLTLLHDAVAPAYYVVNAATRAVTRLPPCQDVLFSSAGLGFDARAREYKVMRLLRKPKDPDVSCQVYTLGGKHGDRWRPAAGRIPSSFSGTAHCAIRVAAMRNLPPVLARGSLHWLIDGSCPSIDLAASIITYSVTKETFGWVQSPPCGTVGAHLVELDGCLCMVRDLRHGSSPDCSSAIEIWKLQGYATGDWSLDTHINLSSHAGVNLVEPEVIRVLGAVGDGRPAKKIIMATSDHTVHAYDSMSKNVETIFSVADAGVRYPSGRTAIRICLFKETLAPVHKTHEEIYFSSPPAKATKEMLLRLPARSIVQFKRVCKQWRSIIENKSFMRSYFEHKSMEKRTKIMAVGRGSGRRKFFHFAPLEKWRSEAANKDTWLDSKVVCSKPCHGLNLLITAEKDYLYNPCTGYCTTNSYPGSLACAPWETQTPSVDLIIPDHAFTIGNKNVGLGFNPLNQEHVAVIMLYQFKNLKSHMVAGELVIWKLERNEWDIAYLVCLKASPDYSLLSNNVMPMAVDPKDGRILLSTGRKMGFYDRVNETIEKLYDADEIWHMKKMAGASSQGAQYEKSAIPLVPMLYEESLVSYPRTRKDKFLF